MAMQIDLLQKAQQPVAKPPTLDQAFVAAVERGVAAAKAAAEA
jgi:hypothetical protein